MNIYAISDLHISLFNKTSPMDKFGDVWINHLQRVESNWRSTIASDDIVLLGGDTSSGNNIKDAQIDLKWIEDLPGKKVFVKGNHDFWWQGIKKLNLSFSDDFHFIHNNVIEIKKIAIGGSRLWHFPFISWEVNSFNFESKSNKYPKDDKKIRIRELSRLRYSLDKIPKDATTKIALVHYPPIDKDGNENILTDMMSEFSIDFCIFGHLHNLKGPNAGSNMVIGKTRYILSSCDWLKCQLIKVI